MTKFNSMYRTLPPSETIIMIKLHNGEILVVKSSALNKNFSSLHNIMSFHYPAYPHECSSTCKNYMPDDTEGWRTVPDYRP